MRTLLPGRQWLEEQPMSRNITVEGIARAVRYLDRAFLRYSDEAMTEAFKTAGIDDENGSSARLWTAYRR